MLCCIHPLLLALLIPLTAAAQDDPPAIADTTWQPFAPGAISLPDIRETSPSVSADGQTMLFARTENWRDKVPHIATRSGDGWAVVKAPFADTLYNLALAPDGQSAFFKTYDMRDGEEVSRAYRVARTADGWGTPQDLPRLAGINAGYFCPMADGTLYFFARSPRPGIYVAEPDGEGGYGAPQWLSDAVSPEGTTSFDVLMHPTKIGSSSPAPASPTTGWTPSVRAGSTFTAGPRTAGRKRGASTCRTDGAPPCCPTAASSSSMPATCRWCRWPRSASIGNRGRLLLNSPM